MTNRFITNEDLYQMKCTGSPSISPNGKSVVYVVTEMDENKNGYYSALYQSDLEGNTRQLTKPDHQEKLIRDTAPQWAPNGKTIAFLSNRSEKKQIWLLSVDKENVTQLTNCASDITEFNWSPDGKHIVYTAMEGTSKKSDDNVTVITRLRYKADGEGIVAGFKQLYTCEVQTADSKQITYEPYHHHSPSFTPCGQKVMYLAAKKDNREWVDLDSLYLFDLEEETEQLLYEGKGNIIDPCMSPNGRHIAFAGHDEGETSSANTWIWVVSVEGGKARKLSQTFDYPVGNYIGVDVNHDAGRSVLKWEDDGDAILFLATVHGDCYIKHVSLDGTVESVVENHGHVLTSFDSKDGRIVFVMASPLSLGELYVKTGDNIQQLSHHHEKLFSEIELSKPESFTYQGADGWNMQGWILPPPGLKKGEKCPVVLEVHGGPHGAYGNAFHHEFQRLAAEGYAVVYTNPRGSQGYGDAFVKACVGDWGNKDLQDIMLGLDYALDHYAYCDRDRLYITGGSYGGFMTNMMITRSNRFQAAVTQRCISNLYSFFGTSDIGFFFGASQLGNVDLWEDEETIMQFSPIRYARNVQTPTCIIHSEEDLRCPMEQAEQWYVALSRLGVETRFVRFKGENHNLSRNGRPENRVQRLEEILQWFHAHQ